MIGIVYTDWMNKLIETGEWPRNTTREEYYRMNWFFRFRRREFAKRLRNEGTNG